jgi:hypothetical protein
MKWYETLSPKELNHLTLLCPKKTKAGFRRARELNRYHKLGCTICQRIEVKITNSEKH